MPKIKEQPGFGDNFTLAATRDLKISFDGTFPMDATEPKMEMVLFRTGDWSQSTAPWPGLGTGSWPGGLGLEGTGD